jgi:serine/threonine-protein kinase
MPVAGALADGSPIDWPAAEASTGAERRDLLPELRVIATIADLHRSLPAVLSVGPPPVESRHSADSPTTASWGHLELLECLGGGSSGVVYRAWDRHLQCEVALKLLRVNETLDDPMTSRLVLEGRRLAKVRHPNVVTVHGVLEQDHRVGLWMDLIHGATLERLLVERGPFGAGEAAVIGVDLCRALAAIHAVGVIHRDVKAQNVMREAGGRIVLMDFGTGCEVNETPTRPAAQDLAGTPLYLAPELFTGASPSERTDVYSLGVLLYHLVTGSFPVRAASLDELRVAHAAGMRVRLADARPDLSPAFVRAVDRAIAPGAMHRYASAGALEADLVEALGESQSRVPRRSWFRPRSMAVLALVSLLSVQAWQAGPATRAIGSIAVLPLVNISGDPSQEYLADGLTDQLIGALGELDGISVTSRTSVMQFKGVRRPLPQIASALHVDAVLEGSLMVVPESGAGRRVRINARLIDAGRYSQLWEKTFERTIADVLALQDEIAKAVAEGINLRLLSRRRGVLETRSGRGPSERFVKLVGASPAGVAPVPGCGVRSMDGERYSEQGGQIWLLAGEC